MELANDRDAIALDMGCWTEAGRDTRRNAQTSGDLRPVEVQSAPCTCMKVYDGRGTSADGSQAALSVLDGAPSFPRSALLAVAAHRSTFSSGVNHTYDSRAPKNLMSGHADLWVSIDSESHRAQHAVTRNIDRDSLEKSRNDS